MFSHCFCEKEMANTSNNSYITPIFRFLGQKLTPPRNRTAPRQGVVRIPIPASMSWSRRQMIPERRPVLKRSEGVKQSKQNLIEQKLDPNLNLNWFCNPQNRLTCRETVNQLITGLKRNLKNHTKVILTGFDGFGFVKNPRTCIFWSVFFNRSFLMFVPDLVKLNSQRLKFWTAKKDCRALYKYIYIYFMILVLYHIYHICYHTFLIMCSSSFSCYRYSKYFYCLVHGVLFIEHNPTTFSKLMICRGLCHPGHQFLATAHCLCLEPGRCRVPRDLRCSKAVTVDGENALLKDGSLIAGASKIAGAVFSFGSSVLTPMGQKDTIGWNHWWILFWFRFCSFISYISYNDARID